VESALQEKFREMSTEELLAEHQSGRLADWAYRIAEKEISSRGVIVPARAPELIPTTNDDSFFADHWLGKRSLGSAFWRIYVIGGKLMFLALILIGLVIKNLLPFPPLFLFLLVPAYFLFSTVSVWRCAKNTRKVWLAWIARGFTVIYTSALSYACILSFAK
jgi:hypothetical protein